MISTQFLRNISLKREAVPNFEKYPFHLPVIKQLDEIELHPRVTFFIGENGAGKSTLLEAIAVALGFNPEGGTKNFRFGTRESHSDLHRYLRLSRGAARPRDGFFLRAESFFNVATEIENLGAEVLEAYGGVSLHEKSHGEAFLTLMMNRFGGRGLYLLDEPEAALSPQRQLAVLARIHQLVRAGSQFLIATHSPILMAYPDAVIYACSPAGLKTIDYHETEHYQVTRNFLANPKGMLHELLNQDDLFPPA